MYGGTCINVACIPTKSLITQAEKGVSYPTAHQVKDELTSALRKKNYDKLSGLDNVTIIDGEASFVSENEIRVKRANDELLLQGERIFINTGTAPFMPDVKGIDGKNIYNSTTFMELNEIPEKVAIVGGGFIGLEFASMLLNFGSRVTLLDRSEIFLPKEDRDMADAISQSLTARGLKIMQGTEVAEFVQNDNGVELRCKTRNSLHTISAGAVLVATGRVPQTQKLNAEAAGIAIDKRGYIEVNDKLQTSAKNVWAIGDVHGGAQFTYISLDDFRIIKNQLDGGNYNLLKKRKSFPTSVFLTPPYARIGINETEAREQGIAYKLFTLPTSAIPKAAVLGNKEGLLKALVDKENGKVLGCMLLCNEAHELINIVKIAMDGGLSYEILRDAVYTHPTMAESFNELFS